MKKSWEYKTELELYITIISLEIILSFENDLIYCIQSQFFEEDYLLQICWYTFN